LDRKRFITKSEAREGHEETLVRRSSWSSRLVEPS